MNIINDIIDDIVRQKKEYTEKSLAELITKQAVTPTIIEAESEEK